jgi:hypothetical protein
MNNNNWIDVNDRLPENDDEVLVWPHPNDEAGVITAQYNPWEGGKDYKKWMYSQYESNWGDEYFGTKVTHWQPLPETPKQKDSE